MTQQENIDHDLRLLLGDLQVQLIFSRARITDLEAQLAEYVSMPAPPGPDEKAPARSARRRNGAADAGEPG